MMLNVGVSSSIWIVPGILFCLLLVGLFTWLFVGRLNRQRALATQDTPQPYDVSQAYEHGYQPQQQAPATYQEGEQLSLFSQAQYEQPQVQYPEVMSSQL